MCNCITEIQREATARIRSRYSSKDRLTTRLSWAEGTGLQNVAYNGTTAYMHGVVNYRVEKYLFHSHRTSVEEEYDTEKLKTETVKFNFCPFCGEEYNKGG